MISINKENIQYLETSALWLFLLLNTVSLKKYQFINANVKLIELLLIEKRIDMNNNYITPHQLYMQ